MVNERQQKMLRVGAILFTLLISAWLCARGATQLIAASLLPAQSKAQRSVSHANAQSEPSPRELASTVLSRNIFDSQTGALAWEAPYVEPGVDEKPDAPMVPTGEPELCQGALRLVASFVVPRVPQQSFVSIEADGKIGLYRSGMQVDGHHILGIREHRVFMRPSGRPLCQITMFKGPDLLAQSAAAPVAVQAGPNVYKNEDPDDTWTPGNNEVQGGVTEDELAQGVTKVSDNQYTVARTLIDKALSNPTEVTRAARMVPYEENGRVVGMKVYGLRRKSLLGTLGVQNGDVVRTINGFDLSSPDSALEAYAKLRSMDQLTIAMVRRGQPQNINYTIR